MRTAFQFNAARSKRYRLLNSANEEKEHIPTQSDLAILKKKMEIATVKYRQQRLLDDTVLEIRRRDNDIKIVRDQMLDLNDKFDYYIMMKLKKGTFKSDKMVAPPPGSPSASPKASLFTSVLSNNMKLTLDVEESDTLIE